MILRAAWVVPVTGAPLRDGAVRIVGERIDAIGPAAELCTSAESVLDLGPLALLPGLINPHAHLELSAYAGQLPPAPLWDWMLELVRLRRQPGQTEREMAGVRRGATDLLRAGVTCVGDISRLNLHWQTLRRIPIRKVCFVELLTLADLPPRDLVELRAAVQAVEEDELLTVGISPHAPYSIPAQQIRGSVALAAEMQRPWTMHWAETVEERAFFEDGTAALPAWFAQLANRIGLTTPPCGPTDYLAQCTAELPPGLLAHGNYLTARDATRLAELGHSVAYCPRAHRFYGHPPHPYITLLDAGVNVCLGTDSAASNTGLSMLGEAQFVWQQTPSPVPPGRLLEMITIRAARALGLEEQIGSLEVGKCADLAAFPCPADSDPVTTLIETAPAAAAVWVAGRRIV